jgi:hypothetical protein
MAHGIFQRLTGKDGSVHIDALGALIGEMQSWTLTRRGERGPTEGLFDLHAVFSYLNTPLFTHPEYSEGRVVRLRLGKLRLRLDSSESTTTKLEGKQLVMEALKLEEEGK